MSNLSVPGEVLAFFGEGSGKTLLVKGNPGAGKTIFAFTLLKELKRKGVYLSTRVDTASLYNHIGWLKENLPAENIIDATQSERQKLTGPTLIKPLKYTNVPDFLKGVYERTEIHEHALVIIDSWDAVVSHTGYHEPREREKLEHNLCDFSRKTGTDIIFIAEYVEQKPLDYLVDGVVIATNIIRNDMRRIRTLELQKLRGGPMKQPIYLYSLNGGIFNGFANFQGYKQGVKLTQPSPDISSERLSTGIMDLDNVINGYGNFNLCQGDRTAYGLLQLFFILNSISLGKRICLTLSELSLLRKAKAQLPENPGDRIHILQTENIDELKRYVAELNEQGLMPGTIFFKCFDNLAENDNNIESLILEITRHGGFLFGYFSEGKTVSAELQSMAATSLATQINFGVPCVYSNVPITGLYAMSLDGTDGCTSVTLTPIM